MEEKSASFYWVRKRRFRRPAGAIAVGCPDFHFAADSDSLETPHGRPLGTFA
jgi:hypothetical protein